MTSLVNLTCQRNADFLLVLMKKHDNMQIDTSDLTTWLRQNLYKKTLLVIPFFLKTPDRSEDINFHLVGVCVCFFTKDINTSSLFKSLIASVALMYQLTGFL